MSKKHNPTVGLVPLKWERAKKKWLLQCSVPHIQAKDAGRMNGS
jgi:hypothetical protein